MELKQLLKLFLHWFWLLVLGVILGVVIGITISWIQTPVYQSSTKVLVMRSPQDSTSPIAYLSDTQLTQTFGEFLVTQNVLDATSNDLGFRVGSSQVQTQQIGQTQIIEVFVQNSDPERAALIANTLVKIAIGQYGDLLAKQYRSSEENIQTEIKNVESQMSALQTQIKDQTDVIVGRQKSDILAQINTLQGEAATLQLQIDALSPALSPQAKSDVEQKQGSLDQVKLLLNAYQQVYVNLKVQNKPLGSGSVEENNLALLQQTLSEYQQYYISLNSTLASARQRELQSVSNVAQIDTATAPRSPIKPRIVVNTLLSAAAGLALGVVAIFLIENLAEKTPVVVEEKKPVVEEKKPVVVAEEKKTFGKRKKNARRAEEVREPAVIENPVDSQKEKQG
jgi:polysaccharide biosynthesis transport protein